MRLFTFADDFEEDRATELFESQLFLRHARGVVKMLDNALSMLGPDLDPLQEVLRRLGARHVEYGVLPEHYPIVGEALLYTLETALGDKWNDKVKSGWAGIFDIVSSSMVEGANSLIEEENRLCATQAKEETKKRKETQTQASRQAYAKPLPSPAPVFTSEVEHVQATWAIIKTIPNYTDVAGKILFKRIFQAAPGAMKMFSFARRFGSDSEEFYKHPLFLRHARGVVQMLDTAIGLLGHVEPLIQALRALGARHVEYGALPAHYPIVGEALLYTLEVALGEQHWNDQVKAGWTKIYSAVSTGMTEGAHRRIQEEQRLRNAIEKSSVQETQKKEVSCESFANEVVPLPPGVAPSSEVNHVQDTMKVPEHRVPTKNESKNQVWCDDGLPTLIVSFVQSDTTTTTTVSSPHIKSQEMDKWKAHHQKANNIRQQVRTLRLARRRAACNAAA
jgi:nitric oxide dioxygenase